MPNEEERVADVKKWGTQFIRFGIVGAINTLLSYLIINTCYYFLGFHEQISNAINFVVTVFISFLLNRKFVFNEKEGKQQKWYKALFKVYVSYGITELVLSAILLLLEERVWEIPHYIATVMNLIITVPANFVLNKFWAYRKRNKFE